MKLTMTLGAAIGIAALAGCGQDNYAENVDANAAYTTNETVLPVDDNAAETDTLGNQMDQLNNDTGNVTDNTMDNTTNGY